MAARMRPQLFFLYLNYLAHLKGNGIVRGRQWLTSASIMKFESACMNRRTWTPPKLGFALSDEMHTS